VANDARAAARPSASAAGTGVSVTVLDILAETAATDAAAGGDVVATATGVSSRAGAVSPAVRAFEVLVMVSFILRASEMTAGPLGRALMWLRDGGTAGACGTVTA
jgi:hypothetical protein